MLIVLALYNRRQLGRIHPDTLWAMMILVPLHAASPLIARTDWWNAIAPGLFGFW